MGDFDHVSEPLGQKLFHFSAFRTLPDFSAVKLENRFWDPKWQRKILGAKKIDFFPQIEILFGTVIDNIDKGLQEKVQVPKS